jgi:hypothetical protein
MDKIKRVSLIFRFIFQFCFFALPIIYIIAWATTPGDLVMAGGVINLSFIPPAYTNKIFHSLSVYDRLFGFAVSAIPMAIELYILYSLIKLFKLYEKGEIFTSLNVNHIRHIGYALLISQILNPIYEFLMGVALTLHNPPGKGFAAIGFDLTNIGIILIALITLLISWVMAEACKLREEQQLTI